MKKDVVIIGGGPGGISAAVMGKTLYPEKSFLVIRKSQKAVIPCGIPYIFHSLEYKPERNLTPDDVLKKMGIEILIEEVVGIDKEGKFCELSNGDKVFFDKLIIATGSVPVIPKWLKGSDLENVFVVKKDENYIRSMLNALEKCEKIVVIGGGFIGVEVSDELKELGKDITIVEILPHILSLAFDEDIAERAENLLREKGIKIKTGVGVKEIVGKGKVEEVVLENDERIPADAVILAMGYKPSTELAEKAGLELNKFGFIRVDEYMRTESNDIFAVGDCAEKRDFFTGKLSRVMLASVASKEANIAAMNLFNVSTPKMFQGTVTVFSTVVCGIGFGAAGLTESAARKEGFDIVVGSSESPDKHPASLPETYNQFVKLIVSKKSGVILGGEVVGGKSTGELVNLIGLVVQSRMTITSLLNTQFGTHPLLTPSPVNYSLIRAAGAIMKK